MASSKTIYDFYLYFHIFHDIFCWQTHTQSVISKINVIKNILKSLEVGAVPDNGLCISPEGVNYGVILNTIERSMADQKGKREWKSRKNRDVQRGTNPVASSIWEGNTVELWL